MQAELTFWEWVQRQGYTLNSLADKLSYSAEHLSRIKNGKLPVTTSFVARCVAVFGNEIRQFFLLDVSVDNYNLELESNTDVDANPVEAIAQ